MFPEKDDRGEEHDGDGERHASSAYGEREFEVSDEDIRAVAASADRDGEPARR